MHPADWMQILEDSMDTEKQATNGQDNKPSDEKKPVVNEPSRTIPEEAIKLHGITNEMAAGHKIDCEAISAFASDAASFEMGVDQKSGKTKAVSVDLA
jgi:hypothetical protein